MQSIPFLPNKLHHSQVLVSVFYPIFTWMKFLGISPFILSSKYCIYRWLVLLLFLWSSATTSFQVYLDLLEDNTNVTFTIFWSIMIDYGNHFFYNSSLHLILFFLIPKRWEKLWKIVKELDSAGLNRLKYQRVTYFFYFWAIVLVSSHIGSITYIITNILSSSFIKKSAYEKLTTIFLFLSTLIPLSAMFLYFMISWIVSLYYENICKDIDTRNQVDLKTVLNWKKRLSLASDSVYYISKTFGLALLLSFAHLFVYLTTQAFYIVNSTSRTSKMDIIFTLGRVIWYSGLLIAVAYAPTKLYNEPYLISGKAIGVVYSLRAHSIKNFETGHQSQVSMALAHEIPKPIKIQLKANLFFEQVSIIASELLCTLPKVSAVGCFDVNLHLVPKLFNTTLTYLIILFQFHSSET